MVHPPEEYTRFGKPDIMSSEVVLHGGEWGSTCLTFIRFSIDLAEFLGISGKSRLPCAPGKVLSLSNLAGWVSVKPTMPTTITVSPGTRLS